MAEEIQTIHDSKCVVPHTTEIPCVQIRKMLAAARVNVWICTHGRNGYHSFTTEEDDEVCNYGGCTRTRRELNRSWNVGRAKPDGHGTFG